ncbi:MAG: Ni/Fe-hydrogenase cytochrome b subunit [Chloroflexi bacterium]|nr:Ni/Fe-hydrogenase cytochrome b subunit [Chloroflexota bacterium]
MSPTLEFLIVVFQFIVRIIVPFVLVFGVLYLLKRRLEPHANGSLSKTKTPFNAKPVIVAAVCLIAIVVIGIVLYALVTHQFVNLLLLFRDAMVLGYMFVLRIGVPFTLVFVAGNWLQRKLNPDAAREIKPLTEQLPFLKNIRLPRLSLRGALAIAFVGALWFAAIGIAIVRFFFGLGYTTNLTDQFPWGLWIGFDVVSGIALAAGGFVMAGTVHVFNIKRYHPIVRPAILTALLGYALAVVGLLFDLGRWYNIWHPIFGGMWNIHSPMLEVAWCVVLYGTVLILEFSPAIFERFNLQLPLKVVRAITIPLVIAGMCLSTLHQSSLGSLFLIAPEKINPLWYTPLLPVFFFISAVAVGLGMTIVESNLSARAFGKELEHDLLKGLGRAASIVLAIYLALKVVDLIARGAWTYFTVSGFHAALYSIEMILGVIVPMLVLATRRGRENSRALYASGWLIVGGVVLNRLNTSLLGWWPYAFGGPVYIPSLSEVTITLSLIAGGVVAFGLAAKFLPVFVAETRHGRAHA